MVASIGPPRRRTCERACKGRPKAAAVRRRVNEGRPGVRATAADGCLCELSGAVPRTLTRWSHAVAESLKENIEQDASHSSCFASLIPGREPAWVNRTDARCYCGAC